MNAQKDILGMRLHLFSPDSITKEHFGDLREKKSAVM